MPNSSHITCRGPFNFMEQCINADCTGKSQISTVSSIYTFAICLIILNALCIFNGTVSQSCTYDNVNANSVVPNPLQDISNIATKHAHDNVLNNEVVFNSSQLTDNVLSINVTEQCCNADSIGKSRI